MGVHDRPWLIEGRADTALGERRRQTPKQSDELVSRFISRIKPSSKAVSLKWRVEAGRVVRLSEKMAHQNDDAILAMVEQARKSLITRGFKGAHIVTLAAAVREITGRILDKRHHKVQVMGGLALLRGNIIEMATGEGKTLTNLIPATIAALAGIPVHIVTVNDYLAARDCESLRAVFERFGLSVSCITSETKHHERAALYTHDIVFTTNKDVAFDYLRDRIRLGGYRTGLAALSERLLGDDPQALKPTVSRGLGFAIVDEVDSILIDEAQTPLIITAESGDDDEWAVAKAILNFASTLEEGTHFRLRRNDRQVQLLPACDPVITSMPIEMPDLLPVRARREWLSHALSALHLYHRDEHYIVNDDGVAIVDEFTGRVLADRQWPKGLQQMIEIKEAVETSKARTTIAQITYQAFFSRYLWFSGMTGTAQEVAREFSLSFGRPVVRIPSNRRKRLRQWATRVYGTRDAKWRAVVANARKIAGSGRPVLIGTRSVDASEHVGQMLSDAGCDVHVLNARQDAEEAAIVAEAGTRGRITVATNMAGRGTDIPVPEEVEALGGLHVILTEFHNSSRIDRQFIGRAARQGQRGTAVAIISLQDHVFDSFTPGLRAFARALMLGWRGRMPSPLGELLRIAGQQRSEREGRSRRRRVVRNAAKLQDMLGFRPDNI